MPPDVLPRDEQMDDEISHLLRAHVEIDTTNIQLEVDEGEVILLGSVPEEGMRRAAEILVSGAPGVRKVWNLLRIKREETIFP